jgi:polynucleotide 5'-hydroxyl-kinase GRC3/NOL9
VANRDHFPFLANLDILEEWETAAARFVQDGGTVMVLGAPDTGKSTLCRYLVYRSFAAGHRVALLDLDLGQSHLGPPATLGLALFPPQRPGDEGEIPEALAFIGQTSPLGAILEVAVGCRVLVDIALSLGCTRVVVNTSGLIRGTGALILKRAEAQLLQPALILALARARELEPLLRDLMGAVSSKGSSDGWSIICLPVSSRAVSRSPEERRFFREGRFRRYFKKARRLVLPWRQLVWEGQPWGHGDPLDHVTLEHFHQRLGITPLYGESQGRRAVLLLAEAPEVHLQETSWGGQDWDRIHWLTWPSLHWRLVGLLDGRRRTLALGLVLPEAWDPEALLLWSPLAPPALSRVRFLKVGGLRLNLQGQELAHV